MDETESNRSIMSHKTYAYRGSYGFRLCEKRAVGSDLIHRSDRVE